MQLYKKKLQFTSKLSNIKHPSYCTVQVMCVRPFSHQATLQLLNVYWCFELRSRTNWLSRSSGGWRDSKGSTFPSGIYWTLLTAPPRLPHGCLVFHPAAPDKKSYIKYVHCQHKIRNIAFCFLFLHLSSGAISNISSTVQNHLQKPVQLICVLKEQLTRLWLRKDHRCVRFMDHCSIQCEKLSRSI